MSDAIPATLDALPVGSAARVSAIRWEMVPDAEAARLRDLGLFEGVEVEALHRGALFFRDPLAVRVGRMRVVMRAAHAAAIGIEPAA
jgi:ferrous iron transport protein A